MTADGGGREGLRQRVRCFYEKETENGRGMLEPLPLCIPPSALSASTPHSNSARPRSRGEAPWSAVAERNEVKRRCRFRPSTRGRPSSFAGRPRFSMDSHPAPATAGEALEEVRHKRDARSMGAWAIGKR